jgi:hypothetical protein
MIRETKSGTSTRTFQKMHMLVITSVKSTSEKRNMKNLIFQYNILNEEVDKHRGPVGNKKRSELYREVADISSRSFQIYSEHLGCDYLFSDEQFVTKGHTDPYTYLFECLRIIYDESFDCYDKILFADADVVCNTFENIFEVSDAEVCAVLESDIVTENGGGYNVWDLKPSSLRDYTEKFASLDCPIVPAVYPNRPSRLSIINSGVMVWNKEARLKARERFDDWKDWLYGEPKKHMTIMLDQPFISAQLMKHDIDFEGIPQTWNDTPTHYNTIEKGMKSNFLHYTGGDNKLKMLEHNSQLLFRIFFEGFDE